MTGVTAGQEYRVGVVDGVEFAFALTDRPWELDIDGIVLSVGSGLGSLGEAVRAEFPDALWNEINYLGISAANPVVSDLPLHRESWLRRAILVTARSDRGVEATAASIITATRAALTAASDAGVTAVGMPLLGTGVLGEDLTKVAHAMVPAAVAMTQRLRRLQRIVFFGQTESTVATIRKEFAELGFAEAEVRSPVAPEGGDLAGGISSDLVDPTQPIALEKDRLGFAPYVSMLATVIADRETPLPLSIGVFGPWGAGKSYFMGLLRTEVGRLARQDDRYCGEIAQIAFNAWHYADSNLWASLGDEIFRQLAGSETKPKERAEQIRTELAGQLEHRKQLEAATRQARETAADLRAQVDKAAADRDVSARDLVAAIGKSTKLRVGIDKLWDRLGIRDEAERGKLLAEELSGTLTEADVLRRAPKERRGRIALAVAAILLLGGLFTVAIAPELRAWLAGVGGAFVLVAGWGTYALAKARSGLRQLRELTEDLHSGLAREADKSVGDMLARLREAEAEQLVAEAQLKQVVQHVGELGRELAQLAPGSRLYSFLADRARSEAYSGNLGLISLIRKDFKQLVDLMADWRANPDQGDSPRRPVERIVLYIDDLDRCSPRQVVEVLQAVHLLLAFELFVVVVGVDPRWLLSSVRSHYGEILDGHATPEDYLEKIVNIPFVLPGMTDGSMSRLLGGLVAESIVDEPGSTIVDVPSPPPVAAPGLITVEPGSEVDTQRQPRREVSPPRPLTQPELELLSALDPLVATPREAKRIINLYRMIRATRNLSDAASFLGGEYQVVIVLLGLLTAHADLTCVVFDAVMRRFPGTGWTAFVAELAPHKENDVWRNDLVGAIPDEAVARWRHLHDGLAKVSNQVTIDDVTDVRGWIPRIRRFSYVLPG
ncbi:P-loop NTPase fold protein [Kutzneria sp. CA-103260]|uniref:P-loop NTPase fold protein n=1 Tax=Kutzneria sp. CA-103260 TaxID=2802641 RepID=UPI001BA6E838|nr:P-loop NTPase fold protein [Kutzneria sp. CA-103260]QUQ62351.1 KAP family P-loop domain protein [Kutzneria sp. CA-103260]